jgi:hypothetical protein
MARDLKYMDYATKLNPRNIIFVIDQSINSSRMTNSGDTYSSIIANHVNEQINEMIMCNIGMDLDIVDRLFISLITYGRDIKLINSRILSSYAENPKRVETHIKTVIVKNEVLQISELNPVFLDPTSDGKCFAGEGFQKAIEILKGQSNTNSKIQPYIYHYCCGVKEDGSLFMENSNLLRKMNVQIFNNLVTGKTILPFTEKLTFDNDTEKLLFELSSNRNEIQLEKAQRNGLKLEQSTKLFTSGIKGIKDFRNLVDKYGMFC